MWVRQHRRNQAKRTDVPRGKGGPTKPPFWTAPIARRCAGGVAAGRGGAAALARARGPAAGAPQAATAAPAPGLAMPWPLENLFLLVLAWVPKRRDTGGHPAHGPSEKYPRPRGTWRGGGKRGRKGECPIRRPVAQGVVLGGTSSAAPQKRVKALPLRGGKRKGREGAIADPPRQMIEWASVRPVDAGGRPAGPRPPRRGPRAQRNPRERRGARRARPRSMQKRGFTWCSQGLKRK